TAEWLEQLRRELATRPTFASQERSGTASEISDKILFNSPSLREVVNNHSLGGNVPYGRPSADLCVRRRSLALARTVLDQLGLNRTTDFEKWDKAIDGYLAQRFSLAEPAGQRRPLEDLHSPEHDAMVAFRRQLLELMCVDASKD